MNQQPVIRKNFWRTLWPARKRWLTLLIVAVILAGTGTFFVLKNLNTKQTDSNAITSQYRERLPELEQKVKDNPNDASAHKEYAVALYATGDMKKAKEQYEAAIKLNGSDATAYNNLGNTYRDLGDINKAIESYKKASELSPKLVNPYVNLANIQLYSQNKPQDAIATYQAALKQLPDNDQIRVLLALAYEKADDISNAKQTYENILARDPDNAAAKANLDRLNQ